ncbi:low-density lipoprotein receptor-related protein 4-like isoform X1 [Pecten maximus]|uniref:low-density lipoprotein receptor-related protein 4-like isoform X1 n=2 Tax=Pecten maximus TaxID=6579 RepID=UPI0014586936|nr:low-density lipoprotein receptor-related protein 4-like isoform X1 [Pecten maximus]
MYCRRKNCINMAAVKWTIVLYGLLSLAGAEYYVFMNGDKANQGNVEINNGTAWYNLCTDGWDDTDAAVMCRMLGYTGDGANASVSDDGVTFSSQLQDKFDCDGTESSLQDCQTSSNNANACENSTRSHMACSDDPVPNDFFLVSLATAIARMDRKTGSLSLVQSGTLERVIAITYDSVRNNIIWTDINLNQIALCGINGGDITVLHQAGNASVMDGIAIDEGSRQVFYTDTGYDEIGMINLDTLVKTIVINTDLDEPRAIALDTTTREIFWTDWGANPRIEKSNYDGSGRTIIVSTGLGWPNAIVLNGDVLIWCDAQTDVFESVHTNGTGRVELISFNNHCFDFAIYEEYIYVNDWVYSKMVRVQTNGSVAELFGPSLSRRYGIFHYIKGNISYIYEFLSVKSVIVILYLLPNFKIYIFIYWALK